MAYDDDAHDAYYFFQHDTPDCGTSLLVNVELFRAYIKETLPDDMIYKSENCENHCVNLKDIKECSQECLHAPFRRFLLAMINIKAKTFAEKRLSQKT